GPPPPPPPRGPPGPRGARGQADRKNGDWVIEKTLISQPGRTVCDSISINKPRSARCVSADTSHQQK
ncbi:MAG: hypothetical protein VX603_13110, partial [Gemmatimonadota bacterium]|nr:hypothetical protein [Gemmatimonadota bacterium]